MNVLSALRDAPPGDHRIELGTTDGCGTPSIAIEPRRLEVPLIGAAAELGLWPRVRHLDPPRVDAERHCCAHARLPCPCAPARRRDGCEPDLRRGTEPRPHRAAADDARDPVGRGSRRGPSGRGIGALLLARTPVRRAFATLVTGAEYAPGAVALARSLSVHSELPLIIMCPPALEALADWSRIEGTAAQVRTVDPLPLSRSFLEQHRTDTVHARDPFMHGTKPGYHSIADNFMKLRAWQLEEYDRIAFLDADTLCMRNPDSIFRYEPFAGAPNVYTPADTRRRLNGGVFVLRPDRKRFDALLRELDAPGAYWRRSDQTFLEASFPDWDRLPEGYNRLQYVWINMPERWRWEEIVIVHYQFEKPWDRRGAANPSLAPLAELWWQVFAEGRLPARLPAPSPARSR